MRGSLRRPGGLTPTGQGRPRTVARFSLWRGWRATRWLGCVQRSHARARGRPVLLPPRPQLWGRGGPHVRLPDAILTAGTERFIRGIAQRRHGDHGGAGSGGVRSLHSEFPTSSRWGRSRRRSEARPPRYADGSPWAQGASARFGLWQSCERGSPRNLQGTATSRDGGVASGGGSGRRCGLFVDSPHDEAPSRSNWEGARVLVNAWWAQTDSNRRHLLCKDCGKRQNGTRGIPSHSESCGGILG